MSTMSAGKFVCIKPKKKEKKLEKSTKIMVQQGDPRPKENSKNREQKWLKYRQQHQWTAFKRERN